MNIRLGSPRFELAQRYANKVLVALGRPKPPIPIINYVKLMKWKVDYIDLFGPEGLAAKFNIKGKTRFGIFIATDIDEGMSTSQIERCQNWTLAHEIGHILLHSHFILNSSLFHGEEIDENTKGVLEVEAHWFASRLLMPDYIFTDRWDLDPQRLSEKCNVNLIPAQKRIDGLTLAHRRELSFLEPIELIEQRRLAKEQALEYQIRQNLERNEVILDRLRRYYGYE